MKRQTSNVRRNFLFAKHKCKAVKLLRLSSKNYGRIVNSSIDLLMRIILLLAVATIFFTGFNRKTSIADLSQPVSDTTPVYEMKQYWLVFLYSGGVRSQDSVASARIQQAHMNNIERLAAEGKIIMAGPMGDKGNLRGIFIMDGKDSTEIANHIKVGSASVTGRLRFEIRPWWTAKGKFEFK